MGRCGFAVVVASAFSSLALAQTVEFIPLPERFYPLGASGDGQVVVGYRYPGSPRAAQAWSQSQGLVELLLPDGSPVAAKAWAASQDGSVIAGTVAIDGRQLPFRWTAQTGLVPIEGVGPGLGPTNGYGISADGSVIVGGGGVNGLPGFSWSLDSGPSPLPMPNGASFTYALAASPDGLFACGGSLMAGGGRSIVIWDLVNHSYRAWVGPDPDATRGDAFDVSADGQACVGYFAIHNNDHGTLMTSNGSQIVAPPSGHSDLQFHAMTPDARWIVGGVDGASPWGGNAVIFTQGLGTVLLSTWLREQWNFTIPEYVPWRGIAISDDGRTIAGVGNRTNSGFASGWILRLPAARPADFNADEHVDFLDFNDFIDCFEGRSILPVSSADLNHDGFTDFFDLDYFLENF